MNFTEQQMFCSMWKLLFCHHTRVLRRNFARLIRKQDPEEVKNMPVYEFKGPRKRTKSVYMWGNTICGALGNSSFNDSKTRPPLKSMRRPWRFYFADTHRVHDISCGNGFTVIAAENDSTNYSLFGTGLNSDYQIGYHSVRKDHPLEVISEPLPIILPLHYSSAKAVKISCGRAHTIVITDKEGVFSLGNNAYGQCGCPPPKVKTKGGIARINKVQGLNQDISQVICGQDHTMFLTSAGEVYSCGWGADGQTGYVVAQILVHDNNATARRAVLMEEYQKAAYNLHHCPLCRPLYQSLEHYNNQFIPERVKGDIDGEKIIQLSSSADCVLAVSDKGDVFGWGNSEYGQLNSITDKQQINIPKHLNFSNIGKISQVASGGTMCAVLSVKGNVYVWGYGILGQGPAVTFLEKPSLLPEPLFGFNEYNTDVKVAQLTCGLSHFAAITNKGCLYMWGRNRSNCLGLGSDRHQYFPFRICVPEEVQKVSCGVDHTAVISKTLT